ncbi:polymorphic toxin-type HINT domain-containing protein [Streptomyces sp. NPDC026092]|uniref:polymorphic toxin-type HINT domain-containing protein n=1 Tax=Streptomyces sp. NPDC026092 TaxID=3154797 RepID=UPI0033C4AFB7
MRRAGVVLSALVAMSLLPTQAMASPPPDDPESHSVKLPDLQQTEKAPEDEAKTEELASWSGTPVDPPAEFNPNPDEVIPPAADTGSVDLTQAAGALVPVEDLPVKIGQATAPEGEPAPPAPSGTWNVEVEARTATETADVDGAIITVTPPPTGSTPLDVELDYGTFEDLYGTEWASRLQFVQLPECFLTTPELDECSTPVDVPSVNDAGADTVRATIDPAAGQTQGLSSQAGGGTTVLAATDSGAGAGGNYRASSLSPSGSWTAGSSGGGFSWTYPLGVPAPPAGPAPKINLSYSSQAVDGKTSVANGQASWVGDGWDYHPGYVERRYRTCSDDRKNNPGAPNNTGSADKEKADLCWASENLVLSLGGSTTELVRNDADGKWVSASGDGTKVEYLGKDGQPKGNQTSTYAGEYWQVTTPDGTRYLFGRDGVAAAGQPNLTDSVLTVPVAGNHAGEPCHQASYASSLCTQAWRWNLDQVVDVHGNAMTIGWQSELNHYAQNGKFTAAKAYERAGYPTQILYGLRSDNLGGPPAGKVVFKTEQRCIKEGTTACSDAEFESKNYGDKQPWWDTPSTLYCKPGQAKCYVTAPTFWSRVRLTTIETFGQRTPGSTALSIVDSWSLKHSFPKQRTDTHPPLWLESISRTGYGTKKDSDGNPIGEPMPAVSFLPNVRDMPNRVRTGADDHTPDFDRLRVETIRTETGGEIYVDYSEPCPVGASHPAPDKNGTLCFPAHWSPDPEVEKPSIEWFNKYVVDRVVEKDRATRQLDVVTSYAYEGAGWAKDTDEFSKAELRTFNQWRGHSQVTVTRGETANGGTSKATEQSKTVTRYFRGMSGDAGRAEITVKDSEGKLTLAEDLPAYQGRVAETLTYTKAGAGGTVHARELFWPYVKETATRARGDGLPPLKAYRMGTVRTDKIQSLGGSNTRTVRTETDYDDTYGLPLTQYTYAVAPDGTTRSDESCASTQYVHNTGAHLIGLPSHVQSVTGTCQVANPSPDRIIAETRTSYDALNAFGAAPTKGLPRQVDTIDGDGDGWITSARTEYDTLGRATKVQDAKNNSTTSEYVPATGPAFQVKTTNAKGHTAITTVDPARGSALSATDTNGRTTTSEYDAFGRVTAIWSPSRQAPAPASVRFDYQLSDNKVPAVTTRTLRDNGTYASSVALYDGMLRPRQTQSEAHGSGRIVTDTLYNANGAVSETKSAYLAPGDPVAEVFVPQTVFEVPHSTETAYDGLGRAVRVTTMKNDDPQHSAVTEYGPDWTLSRTGMSADGTTPLAGSRSARTATDAFGRTTEVRHYTTTNLTGPNPAAVTTSYTYDPRGKLAKVTDAAGNAWTYAYDVRGRLTTTTDPDMGRSTFGYDELDREVWSKDAVERAQHTLYDELGRTTESREDSVTGPLVTKWTYDTLPGAKGQPVATIHYAQGAAYTSEVTGYDTEYRPTGSKLTIPATTETTGLAGTYAYGYTYTPTGKLQSTDLPATPAGLAAEKLITRYDEEGAPVTTSGAAWYTSGTVYGPLGQVLRTTSGKAPLRVWTNNLYDEFTGRLQETQSLREATIPNSTISKRTYGYDTIGNVTSIADQQTDVNGGVPSTATDQQCFSYDPMGRMVHAWTGQTGCPTAATTQGSGPDRTQTTAGIDGGGYWHSYAFDAIGNRTEMTVHDLANGDLDDVFTYTYGKTDTNNGTQAPELVQPHTLTRVDGTVKEQGSSVTSLSTYASDPAGNTTQRMIGGDTQTLTWDRRNKVTSVSGFGNGSGVWKNHTGKCLDLQGAVTADGTPIQLYTCNGTAAQRWNVNGDALRVLGKCATAEGTKLVVKTCVAGNKAQEFVDRADDDSLYHPQSNTCVDIPNGDYTDGKDLQLVACDQQNPQKWQPGDETRYIYDASGNRLIENTATTRTLYLPDARVTVSTAGAAISAERYYTHPGAPTTVRTTAGTPSSAKLSVLLTDHQGTSTTAVDMTAGQPLTRRAFDPYGNPRGTKDPTATDNWPGRQTFVGTGVNDPTTGLTHIGAREYDPTTGRFLSVDPLIDINDPLQMNGYTYANGSPVTGSDPSGLFCDGCSANKDNSAWENHGPGCTTEGCYENVPGTEASATEAFVATVALYTAGAPKVRNSKNTSEAEFDEAVRRYQSTSAGPVSDAAMQMWWYGADLDDIEYFRNNYCKFLKCNVGGIKEAAAAAIHGIVETPFRDPIKEAVVGSVQAAAGAKAILGAGSKVASRLKGCFNSFIAGTKVLLANGTTKPIEDVRTGDEVLATDPKTGETVAQEVTATILTEDDKKYIALTVATGNGTNATITTTEHHPFWSESDRDWKEAADLKPGVSLRTDDGSPAELLTTHNYAAEQTTYNLTVADLHTYYVLAGNTPVLVHNTGPTPLCDLTKPGPYAVESIPARSQSQRFTKAENDAINRIGDWFGCHSCGTSSPGRPNWTPDHQPVSRFVLPGTPQRLYPHCMACSSRQGGLVGHMPANSGVPYAPRPNGLPEE